MTTNRARVDNLRSVLVQVPGLLSDNDRYSFHFLIGTYVPRVIRENPTYQGTFALIESLFDQNIINDDDITFLIDAFKTIRCFTIANILENYINQIKSDSKHDSKQIVRSLIDELNSDHNDKIIVPKRPPGSLSNHQKKSKLSVHSPKITSETRDYLSSRRKIYSILTFLSIIGCIVIVAISTRKTNLRNATQTTEDFSTTTKIYGNVKKAVNIPVEKRNSILYRQVFDTSNNEVLSTSTKKDESAKTTHSVPIEYENRIKYGRVFVKSNVKDLSTSAKRDENAKITLSIPNGDRNPIKYGEVFGKSNGEDFDDKDINSFKPLSHYLHGIRVYDNKTGLESYQFIYILSPNDKNPIVSNRYGNQTNLLDDEDNVPKDEKFTKVQGRLINKNITLTNETNHSITIITGLRFRSNKDRLTSLYDYELGEEFSEEYEGYTLGYVTGRSAEYLEQVQFVWYRTLSQNSDED